VRDHSHKVLTLVHSCIVSESTETPPKDKPTNLPTAQLTSPCTCTLCARDFKSALALSRHLSKAHEWLKPYACSVCGDTFRLLDEYRKHHRSYRNKCFTCERCGEGFSSACANNCHATNCRLEAPATQVFSRLSSSFQSAGVAVERNEAAKTPRVKQEFILEQTSISVCNTAEEQVPGEANGEKGMLFRFIPIYFGKPTSPMF